MQVDQEMLFEIILVLPPPYLRATLNFTLLTFIYLGCQLFGYQTPS